MSIIYIEIIEKRKLNEFIEEQCCVGTAFMHMFIVFIPF